MAGFANCTLTLARIISGRVGREPDQMVRLCFCSALTGPSRHVGDPGSRVSAACSLSRCSAVLRGAGAEDAPEPHLAAGGPLSPEEERRRAGFPEFSRPATGMADPAV